jgi:hypothetical protein
MKIITNILVFLIVLAVVFSVNAAASKVSIVRSLPASSFPESAFTVTLAMDINESVSFPAMGLYEYYPTGWTVSNISAGGIDRSGHIEWLFSIITPNPIEDRNITYTLHVPASASGTFWFNGNTDIDGGNPIDTIGDDYITIVPYRIIVTRDLPSNAYTDSNITVYLNLDVSESRKPNALGLVEFFPLGWTVSNISNGGIKRNTSIEWVFSSLTSPVQDTNISYVLSVPSDANGTYPFSGQFNYTSSLGAVSESTIGDSSVFATDKCALLGDAPPCGVVEIPEVIGVITQWSTGEATLADVIAMINAWMLSI